MSGGTGHPRRITEGRSTIRCADAASVGQHARKAMTNSRRYGERLNLAGRLSRTERLVTALGLGNSLGPSARLAFPTRVKRSIASRPGT